MTHDYEPERELEEQFIEDCPDRYLSNLEEVEELCYDSTIIGRTKSGVSIGFETTEVLLEAGWVIVAHGSRDNGGHNFYFHRITTEEREVERTITETETVFIVEDA